MFFQGIRPAPFYKHRLYTTPDLCLSTLFHLLDLMIYTFFWWSEQLLPVLVVSGWKQVTLGQVEGEQVLSR